MDPIHFLAGTSLSRQEKHNQTLDQIDQFYDQNGCETLLACRKCLASLTRRMLNRLSRHGSPRDFAAELKNM